MARVLGGDRLADRWNVLDPWWDSYTDVGHTTAIELSEALAKSMERWTRSDGPFETDPLGADVTRSLPQWAAQPGREEDWSDWLARLLDASPSLMHDLFGESVDHAPSDVLREAKLQNSAGTTRFADLLVRYDDRGYSVEVKLDDTHYEKTVETATLVEERYPNRAWAHAILLPSSNLEQLKATVPVEPAGGGRPQVVSETTAPINVCYWEDVSAALRSILFDGTIVDDHWATSAYLFCTLIEQQLLGYKPYPVLKRLAAPSTVVETIRPAMYASTLERQLHYLTTRTH
jgi:hypothetical protein